MSIRRTIHTHRRNFLETGTMTDYDFEVQQLIGQLDDAATRSEATWGIGVLSNLVPPDMKAKWQRQTERLNNAITRNDLVALRDLVPGTIRGYMAMEAAARAAGYVPEEGAVWYGQNPETGFSVAVCRCNRDAVSVPAGTPVYTLEEIARILEKQQLVNVVKTAFPGTKIDAVNFPVDGDELPF